MTSLFRAMYFVLQRTSVMARTATRLTKSTAPLRHSPSVHLEVLEQKKLNWTEWLFEELTGTISYFLTKKL